MNGKLVPVDAHTGRTQEPAVRCARCGGGFGGLVMVNERTFVHRDPGYCDGRRPSIRHLTNIAEDAMMTECLRGTNNISTKAGA